MANLHPAAAQLSDELGALAARIGAALGADLQLAMTERAQARAGWLVAEMESGRLPDETAADLLTLLWPDDPPLDWWRTPLGILVAPTAARETDVPGWSRAETAQVLGKSAGTVAQLTARGTLELAPDGRISRQAVLNRLVRMHGSRVRAAANRPPRDNTVPLRDDGCDVC
jgi:hypothetical protein